MGKISSFSRVFPIESAITWGVYTFFNHTHLVQAASYNWSTSIYHHLAKSRPCSHFGALVMLASMTVDCWHPRPRGRKWDIRSIMGYPKSIEHPLKETVEISSYPPLNGYFAWYTPVSNLDRKSLPPERVWMVVWNIFYFPNSWDDDPIWRTHILQGGGSTTN